MLYKNLCAITIVLLIISINCQLPPCTKVTYDYHVLSLTWPNQFCLKATTCDANWKNMWDNRTMTIHGFWPSSTNLAYLTCLKQHPYDPYCYKPFTYNQSLFTATDISLLQKYWPQLAIQKTLWNHEWLKHGTCYLHIAKQVYSSSLSDAEIFKKYFQDTITRDRLLDIRLSPGQIKTKIDLGNLIGRKPSQFVVVCSGNIYLSQIKICYTVSSIPGKQTVRQCPPLNESCAYPITVRAPASLRIQQQLQSE